MSALPGTILLTLILAAPVSAVFGQEPSPENTEPTAEATQTGRIVEGRPPLYSIKRGAHPLTWVEEAFKPMFRLAQSDWAQGLLTRKPDKEKRTGVGFGVGGLGTASGFGPLVTFYHKDLLGRGIDVEVPLLYTYSRYQSYQFRASVPLISESFVNRLSFDLGAGYSSRARDDFFGIGNETLRRGEAQLRTVTREASTGFTAKLNDDWTSGLHGVYRRVGVTKPTFGTSVQDRFDEASTPGLFGAALRSIVFSIGHDNSKIENRTFKGGTDQVEFSFNQSAGGNEFEYWRYHFDSQHFFWLTADGRKVIAVRGLVETNRATRGHRVPFFDMPMLGNSDTLRGFENFRFRDKSAALMTIEYRYRIWPAMDWGLFIDQGQVAPQLGDLALSRFHTGYGVRLFVWPKADYPISLDYGRSHESWRFNLNLNAKF